jgi:hypothetical protein
VIFVIVALIRNIYIYIYIYIYSISIFATRTNTQTFKNRTSDIDSDILDTPHAYLNALHGQWNWEVWEKGKKTIRGKRMTILPTESVIRINSERGEREKRSLANPQNHVYCLKIARQSHTNKVPNKQKEWSSSPSFSHPNSFLFHNFTAEEEE